MTLFSLIMVAPLIKWEDYGIREWRRWWDYVSSRGHSIRAQRTDFPPLSLSLSLTGGGVGGSRELRGPQEALTAQGAHANPCLWRTLRKLHHCKQDA